MPGRNLETFMPATRDDLMAFFDRLGIETKTVDHRPVFTVAEGADIHAMIPGAHTRNLFVKDKKGKLFLIVVLHDATVDLKQVHTLIGGSGRVSFGSPDQMMQYLGVVPGSVTPFGLINDTGQELVVVFDAAMMQHEVLNFHPLSNDATTTISRDGLLTFARGCGHTPLVIAVTEEAKAQGL
jgi:Ala-tRNA(Pro) deacylase